MLKTKCFIVGMILVLSLQTKGISYCTCTPIGAIARKQEEERREQEQREQLNKLLNERIEQGKMIDTTVDNRELSLTECVLGAIGIAMVCCLPLLALIIIEQATK